VQHDSLTGDEVYESIQQSPPHGGRVAAPVRKCHEAYQSGADGVVAHNATWLVSDHPVRSK